MLKITEIYTQYKEGKKFKTVLDLLEEPLCIKRPSDLVGSKMQGLAKEQFKYLK